MSITIRNKIVEELFTSKEFNDCIKKMQPVELQDDLRSEVALILLEHKDLILIYQSGGLRYYTVRIIINLIQSKTSPFYKKYRQQHAQIWDGICIEDGWLYAKQNIPYVNQFEQEEEINERLQKELKEEKILSIINDMYWFDAEMIKLYMELGSYREMQKQTKIPYQSCYDAVQSAYAKIRYELRKQNLKPSCV